MPIKNRNIDKEARISPAKIDQYLQYCVIKPSVSSTFIVDTEDISGGDVSDATLANESCDYPRNLLLTTTEDSGSDLDVTATITGEDQFGETISEDIATTGGTGTSAGSKIFATVSNVAFDVTNGASSDTASIGFVDANSDSAKLGFPVKIDSYDDVKMVTWVDDGTTKIETISESTVDTTYHAFLPGQDIVAADDYIFLVKPSKWKKDQSEDAGL